MSTLRDDELSEKYFYAGCFGLPWLWIVHTLNYSAKQRNNEGLLNSDGTLFLFFFIDFDLMTLRKNPCSDLLIHPTLFFLNRWLARRRSHGNCSKGSTMGRSLPKFRNHCNFRLDCLGCCRTGPFHKYFPSWPLYSIA